MIKVTVDFTKGIVMMDGDPCEFVVKDNFEIDAPREEHDTLRQHSNIPPKELFEAPREEPKLSPTYGVKTYCSYLSKRISELEAENLHLINQRTIFEAANTKLANDERNTRKKNAELEKMFFESQATIKEKIGDCIKNEARISELEAITKSLQESCSQLAKNNAELEAELTSYPKKVAPKIAELTAERDDFKNRMHEVHNEWVGALSERDELQERINRAMNILLEIPLGHKLRHETINILTGKDTK